ncbi:MAG: lipid A deacylase LpxR family protein [Inquilinus sp.]|nr:lipid A deacylase LpxR family protein [Inquilinus sp.]
MNRAICVIVACLAASPGYAQDDKDTFEKRIPRSILGDGDDSFLTFTSENDLYGGGTDKNYTNGARVTWFDLGAEPPRLAEWLDRIVPSFRINETTSVYYSLGQNLYTPEDITAAVPDPNDRPYAAFLYGSAGLTSVTDDHIDTIEFTLGVVGPWALGEPTQKAVHEWIGSPDPAGWDNQLENEPGIILSFQRSWPEAYAASPDPLYFRAIPHAGATLGNVYTYANVGLTLQLTPAADRWQAQPLRVRPSIPGSGFFAPPSDTWSWALFAGVEGRAVGRNIFLDGNTFEDSPSVDKRPFVADASAGLAFTLGTTRLSYTVNWRSREFDGQDEPSIFGAVGLGFRF